jgi:hypothetical protein
MRHPPVRDILTGFEGVVKPGEMLRKCCLPSYPIFRALITVHYDFPQLSLAVLAPVARLC